MIGDDDQPATPPPSPPPPIAPAPSPSLGRRLLGSIRALSSAIALPSTPAASSSSSSPSTGRLGLSLLLHLKPDLHLHHQDDPPPSTPASAAASLLRIYHHDHDHHHEQADAPKAKRALHLLPQTPTPSPSPAAAVDHGHHQDQQEDLLDEAAGEGEGDGETKGLNIVLEQHKVDLPVPRQAAGTLLTQDQHQHQVKLVDAPTCPTPRDEHAQDGGAAVVEGHEVLVVAGIMGQATQDDTVALELDDDAVQVEEQQDDDAVQVQEQQDAAQPKGEDIAAEGQEALALGSSENAVQVQEPVVERGVIIATDGESAYDTAVRDHDKAVEQCNTYDDLGTTMENDVAKNDQEEVEQGVVDQGEAAILHDDNAVKDHEVLLLLGAVEGTRDTTDGIAAVEDQGKNVDQCTTSDDLGTTMKNDDAVDDKQVVEQGVVHLTMDDDGSVEEQEVVEEGVADLIMDDDDSVEDHKVLQQGIIDGTDDIAVEKQEKVLEQCSRATKDEYTVKEKEMVLEQGVIDPIYMDLATEDQVKLSIIDNQSTVPMDDIVVKDHDKAVVQYASDAIVTIKDEIPVEEHDTPGNQSVIDKNGRTKDDIDVEGHGYVKEQVIVDNWGTSGDATALEGQKNEAEPRIGDEQIAGKDMDAVHAEGNMSEQRTGDKQGATRSDFTVDKHKDVVERVHNEWGAPENDLAMDRTAYQGTRDWGIVNKEKVKLPEDDRAMDTAAYQGTGDWGIASKEKYKLPARRYPQKPRKLNCPSYMSKGTCTYGPSCHFNHPPQLKSRSDESWRPSERRNHGAAEILELNRLGLPIREGARNCDYYMRTGACRYGKNCHFNHPDHVIDAQFSPPTGWEDNALQMEKSSDHTLDETSHMKKSSDDATLDDRSHMKKSSDDATLDDRSHWKKPSDGATVDDTSYSKKSSDHDTSSSSGVLPPSIFRMLLPPQKVLPSTKAKKKSGWSSASDDSDGCCSADSSDGPLCKQGEQQVDYHERPGRPEYHHPKQSKDKEEVNYPERPGKPDCPFYMRFGDCKFASACNYHHPKDKYPAGRPDEPQCPFLMKRGYCKFGAQCKFYHPEASNPTMQSPTDAKRSVTTDEHHPSTRITLQDYMLPQQPQYPERPGQPECRYYLQFGKCKYLSACIFHHPKDRLAAHSDQIGPETHGMPDCPFYMKSGKCQFGSACEFRHPKDIHATTEEAFGKRTGSGAYDNLSRSDNGVEQQEESIMYPERPGEPECAHYMRQGYCKFQMKCKYHHPGDGLSKKQY